MFVTVWGLFFGVYLQSQGWTPDEIGFVMTAGGLAELLCMTPLGVLADHTRHKRGLMAASVLMILVGCGMIFTWSGAGAAFLSKILSSVAAAAIAPSLTGVTLGMVGQQGLPARLGRNEAWNHAGNASTAVLGGIIGYLYGIPGVFWVMACMGALALFSLWRMDPAHIDYAAARGLDADTEDHAPRKPEDFRALFSDRALLAVGATLFFFHLGNAALLPLLGQSAVARFEVNPAAYTAGTVILAQATMILTALWGARMVQKKGYGLLFTLALLALPVRGCIAGLWADPWNILPVQILDGVGAGLLGVATPGLVARILQGSGHVNMGLGLVLTLQGIGASFSNTYGGFSPTTSATVRPFSPWPPHPAQDFSCLRQRRVLCRPCAASCVRTHPLIKKKRPDAAFCARPRRGSRRLPTFQEAPAGNGALVQDSVGRGQRTFTLPSHTCSA